MSKKNNRISFILDDKITDIDFASNGLRPTHTLLHYLRSLPNHKGTKEGCGEGDCGACTVVVGEKDGEKVDYRAIDSCLIFLPMIHGKHIITVENLEKKTGDKTMLHPIQQAVVEENGTQCGFCTPGIVMSLYALHLEKSKPNTTQIKDALSGNLCRCTGYNSIVKAARKASTFKQKMTLPEKTEAHIIKLLDSISKKETIHINSREQHYYKVFTLHEALRLRQQFPEALIVSGATDCALRVTKKHEVLPLTIDISDVEELKQIKKHNGAYIIGAAVRMEDLKNVAKKPFPALHEMLSVFGSKQIRNMATIGGNIGSASPIGDTLPVLFAYDALVVVQNTKGFREIPLRTFVESYRKTKIKKDEIITAISIPMPQAYDIVKSYKISKRKELDISTVSAGFKLEKNKSGVVTVIVLAYGGMAAFTKRAVETEKYLVGKKWTESNVVKAAELLKTDFSPISDARAGEKMRQIAARNVLLKFWTETK